jgi:hypothetical protein
LKIIYSYFFNNRASISILPIILCCMMCMNISVYAQGGNYSASELQQIVAPIALYPDDLLANVLTASTVPNEISQAASYLAQKGGKVTSMPEQDWEPAVKSLLFFPDVLNSMKQNSEWTQALGYAVINQKDDVMRAVQSYRNSAYNAGNLKSTPEQTVAMSGGVVEIAPTNPQIVYVPQYDPMTAIYPYNGTAPLIGFGVGLVVGNWFGYRNFDWYHNNIVVNPNLYRNFNYRPGGRYYNAANLSARGYAGGNVWRPSPYTRPIARPVTPGGVPKYNRPATRAAGRTPSSSIPMARPPVGTRPPTPMGRPSVPATRPGVPATRPSVPTTRPSMPSTRPSMPMGRPSTPTTRPSYSGSTRPMPSGSAFGNVNRGSSTMNASRRGSVSRGGMSGGGYRGGAPRGGGRRR